MFLLLTIQLLPEILLAVAGVAPMVVIERALAVGAVTVHGFEVRDESA
jgi:hypothetical protein